MDAHLPLRRSILAALLSALALLVVGTSSAHAIGGPVILGGDDLTEHGSFDGGTSQNQQGWLYLEKAIGNIGLQVTRPNDGSIAALGSAASVSDNGDAGGAIRRAAEKHGLTVQYFDGDAAVTAAMQSIANGSYRPAIIWVAGSDASNDLDGCSGAGTEGQALIDGAPAINAFVTEGGGLMSHGTCYEWLSSLLPGLTAPGTGGDSDLYKTPEGEAAFPGVAVSDFNAGPWHNHLEGNFGGLNLLVRSSEVDDTSGQDAAVVIGGSQVTLTAQPRPAPVVAAQIPVDPCQRRSISLVSAERKGTRVLLSGLVAKRLAGQSIAITGTHKKGTLATVRSNGVGQFTARVAAPTGKSLRKARFRARIGKARSVALKLPQSLKSTSAATKGTEVEVRGRVKRSVLGRRNPVTIKRLICGRYRTVGKARPDASGKYVVRFKVSQAGTRSLFRAQSSVLLRPGSKKYVTQYARAVAITLADGTG
jgi:hypothetical protein